MAERPDDPGLEVDFSSLNGWDADFEVHDDFDMPTYVGPYMFMKLPWNTEPAELRRRKVFVEYVMLAGVNDSPAQARQLASLLEPRVFKVNLIPYNPVSTELGGMFECSSRAATEAFKGVLERARIPATVRLTRGRDIEAACGQLASVPRRGDASVR